MNPPDTHAARVRLRRLPGNDDLPPPSRMTPGSAGFDLSAAVAHDVTIPPDDIAVVPCGFAIALPDGYEAQVRPRSGLAMRHGVVPVNSPGTIDADYRGEVCVPLINHGRQAFTVTRGMRIAQMVIARVADVRVELVEDFGDTTARGTGGFGSTGV